MLRTISAFLVVAFVAIPRPGIAQSAAPPPRHGAPADLAARARIDTLLRAAHERGVFYGNVLVARRGGIVYEGSHGTASGTAPLTAGHRFLIGSVGKELSAVGLMMLHEEGALSLDDPVSRFLPSLPAWADRVRLRHLLTYTSGLPDVRYGEVASDADVLSDLQALEALELDPGTAYSYNNNDIFLRMRIIEAASGLSFPEFVRTRLYATCGMTESVVDPAQGAPRFAESYDDEGIVDAWRSPMSGHPAVTARDLYRWTRCLSSGELISGGSLMELTRAFRDGAQSALGMSGVEGGVLQWHGHQGQIASYEALEYVNRVDGLTVVLLSNRKQHQTGSLAGAIEQALKGEPYDLPKKSVELAVRARILHRGYDAGIELLEEIERAGGNDYDLSDLENDLTEAGEYLLEMDRADEAERIYRLAVRRFPESEAARDGLAEAGAELDAMRPPETRGRSGTLYRQLARADSILFTALFADCDANRANALLADDPEFYDDRSGLSIGDDLREDFRRLTESCPAGNGVRRVLLPETVEVHEIPGYGAMQTGVHHFVENGAATATVARFYHLWKRVDGGWRLARIVSLHEIIDAERAAALR